MSIPPDYLERVYAGIVGKIVGVYLGRPFEGWPRDVILNSLGPVRHYVNEKARTFASAAGYNGDFSLIVTDDDVSATFMLVRALQEHDPSSLTSEDMGKTWLNNTIEEHSVFWWGGRGMSTEHTAYLNLKEGIPGGQSGSMVTNGKVMAEQIGGEIFIDGLAMCALGNPALAAKLAQIAASVSHDGEAVYGAMSWAAMEAQAFIDNDVDRLVDCGLSFVPSYSLIAESTVQIRRWAMEDKDWEKTLTRIHENYGYDKFAGACHVIPNHSIKILSLVYGGHSFHEGMHIIVSCGWDTDSNGGNMGALLGLMHGLQGFENGPDWRGPLRDTALVSTADGGYSVNNCTRLAYDLTNLGRKLAGLNLFSVPKDGAQFHLSLPGGVQGFHAPSSTYALDAVRVVQAQAPNGQGGLGIRLKGFDTWCRPAEIMTDTFMPATTLTHVIYEQQASPLVYPGQTLSALVLTEDLPADGIRVGFRLKVNGADSKLVTVDGPAHHFRANEAHQLKFTIPDDFDCQPIQQLGISIKPCGSAPINSTVWLDHIKWTGAPKMTIARPKSATLFKGHDAEPWRRAWVKNTPNWPWYVPGFLVSQSHGEGGLFHGCRDWYDYCVTVRKLVTNIGGPNGLAARVQGLRRWCALMVTRPGKLAIVKAYDEKRIELASIEYEVERYKLYDIALRVKGNMLEGFVDGKQVLTATDDAFVGGGIGIIATKGSLAVEQFEVAPAE